MTTISAAAPIPESLSDPMANTGTKPTNRPNKRGGKFLPALCGFLGTLILTAVILAALPLTVPRLFGYEIFNIVSGSMEPTLPVNSLVYVEKASPEDTLPGEIVAFWENGEVVTHRVTENRSAERVLITRGDANDMEDFDPVPYMNLIGRVKYCLPGLGQLRLSFGSTEGRLALIGIALGGALLNIVASTLRHWQTNKEKKQT